MESRIQKAFRLLKYYIKRGILIRAFKCGCKVYFKGGSSCKEHYPYGTIKKKYSCGCIDYIHGSTYCDEHYTGSRKSKKFPCGCVQNEGSRGWCLKHWGNYFAGIKKKKFKHSGFYTAEDAKHLTGL